MPGEVVAGEDPVLVREIVHRAVERARGGGGPSLVEVKTYRTVDHAENMPSQPYRSEDEVAGWRARDPLRTFRQRLLSEEVTTERELDALASSVEDEISAAVEFALESPDPAPGALWDDMYVDPALNQAPSPLG
jgi:TPP-dependent pyruvate/acetoin dehydrogenase alpha subunit